MIDLHSHILPGIDDGAEDLQAAIEMATIAVGDGIEIIACTPHIYPGLYANDRQGIVRAKDALEAELDRRHIPLRLIVGADVHLVPGVLDGIKAGSIPTLHGSRYVLVEPSHHIAPPRFSEAVFDLIAAGYVPVITHPERLTWIEDRFADFVDLARHGAWLQVTAGALTGAFGKRAKYWADRLVAEGRAHLLASDAHSARRRRPVLSEGLAVAEKLVGATEASRLVRERPQAILDDAPPSQVAPPAKELRTWRNLFGFGHHQ